MGQSRMTHFQRMTHFPAFQLANSFILIGWAVLEKVVLPYNSAILRKKPWQLANHYLFDNTASQSTKFIYKKIAP